MFGELASWEEMASVAHIFLVNLVLSGDNAVVIALAARRLPIAQRRKAIVWGILVAVLLRIGLTYFATYLVQVPALMILGGALLFYIAYKLLVDDSPEESAGSIGKASPKDLAAAIRLICAADLIMSLDNVLAVAGASHGNQSHMILGLISSVFCIAVLGNLISATMDRFQWLVYPGAGILAFTAAQMVISTHELQHLSDQTASVVAETLNRAGMLRVPSPSVDMEWLAWPLEATAAFGCLLLGYRKRRKHRPEIEGHWQEAVTIQMAETAGDA